LGTHRVSADSNFEDTLERSFGYVLRIEQANVLLFDTELFNVASGQFHDHHDLLRTTDRDAELGVLNLGQCLVEKVHADTKAVALKSVAQLPEVIDPPMHGSAAPLRRIKART